MIELGKWYRIAGRVIYVTRFSIDVSRKSKGYNGKVWGILRKDFATYMCGLVIYPSTTDTIAQHYYLKSPQEVMYSFSDKTKIQGLAYQEVFSLNRVTHWS